MRVGVIHQSADLKSYGDALIEQWSKKTSPSTRLLDLSGLCSGDDIEAIDAVRQQIKSGRSLRRLPLLAHARHIKQEGVCTLEDMIKALANTVQDLQDSPK